MVLGQFIESRKKAAITYIPVFQKQQQLQAWRKNGRALRPLVWSRNPVVRHNSAIR